MKYRRLLQFVSSFFSVVIFTFCILSCTDTDIHPASGSESQQTDLYATVFIDPATTHSYDAESKTAAAKDVLLKGFRYWIGRGENATGNIGARIVRVSDNQVLFEKAKIFKASELSDDGLGRATVSFSEPLTLKDGSLYRLEILCSSSSTDGVGKGIYWAEYLGDTAGPYTAGKSILHTLWPTESYKTWSKRSDFTFQTITRRETGKDKIDQSQPEYNSFTTVNQPGIFEYGQEFKAVYRAE